MRFEILRLFSGIILALALFLHAEPIWAAACPLVKSCSGGGTITTGGIPVSFDVSGEGLADFHDETGDITWTEVTMTGTSDMAGDLTITLDPAQTSTGTLDCFTPRPYCNSGNITNDFYFRIESSELGTLVSLAPVEISGPAPSIPPTGTYAMIGASVGFYPEGGDEKDVVFTLESATINVKPFQSTPALSGWGPILLVVVLGSALTVAIIFRIGASTTA